MITTRLILPVRTNGCQVMSAPAVSLGGGEAGSLYTLIKTDPDAPTRAQPAYREFVHWVGERARSASRGGGHRGYPDLPWSVLVRRVSVRGPLGKGAEPPRLACGVGCVGAGGAR
jgi:hypothetical protein